MINEPLITITGNLTHDPELRFTPAGIAAASFSVASNPRYRNAAGGWVDGETVYYRVTSWRDEAENVCDSLRRGDPVTVIGRVRANVWTDREDKERRENVITADLVAVPLARHRVKLTRVSRERSEPVPDSPEPGPHADGPGDAGEPGAAPDGPETAGNGKLAGGSRAQAAGAARSGRNRGK